MKPEEAMEEAWRVVRATTPTEDFDPSLGPPIGMLSWRPVLSPPFPVVWPPAPDGGDGRGQVILYAFASGFRFGLTDGEEIGGPWALLAVDVRSRTMELELLADRVKSIGVQGVRLLQTDEVATYRSREEVCADLDRAVAAGSLEGIDDERLRRFYQQWSNDNGRVARWVGKRHKAFFRWLKGA